MIRKPPDNYLAKDYIETAEGLVFAVVDNEKEQGRVLGFLRYRKIPSGWQKLSTQQANSFLQINYPDYLFYSINKDARLHAVATDRIIKHYQPEQVLPNILQSVSEDQVIQDLQKFYQLLVNAGLELKNSGVTGSILINGQRQNSDIDLVIYNRAEFFKLREQVKILIGNSQLKGLTEGDWQASYQRRSCELNFAEYVWHEQRKYNKAMINARKIDLSFVDPLYSEGNAKYTKLGLIKIQALITDHTQAFDYPAIFMIDSQEAQSVVSYTATYTGQAFAGEKVEIVGLLERAENGQCRVIVGSSREAESEYIKVLLK